MSQKRKIDNEHRVFQTKWEMLYFFIEWKGKPLCLVCKQTIAVCKEFNVKRHYETNHKENFDSLTVESRQEKLESLKTKLKGEQSFFMKAKNDSENAMRASYVIALKIAKNSKAFSDGEFVKECMLDVADISFPSQKQTVQEIPLSRNTIASRVNELADNLNYQLKDKIKEFVFYSIAADESTDINDTSQLAVFIRGINTDFVITEELLECVPLKGTTTAHDIYSAIEKLMVNFGLDWKKFCSITTDGAPSMIGKNAGVVTKIRNKILDEIKPEHKFVGIHCILHQESLASKILKMDHVMKPVIKTINFIRSRGLNHRQFIQFLKDLEEKHADIPYFTEVRWLSRGATLKRFFELREHIVTFMNQKGKPMDHNDEWWLDCAFLVDMTEHFNNLNVKLQGKNLIATQMYSHVQAFIMKLKLWKTQLREQKLDHFPNIRACGTYSADKLTKFSDLLLDIIDEFDRRFADFRELNMYEFPLFNNPFTFEVEKAPTNMQMELIDLQCDTVLKEKFNEVDILTFYTKYFKSHSNYPNMRNHAARILSISGSSYSCEQLFSTMKINKSQYRSRLTDEHLQSILKINTTALTPNIDDIMKLKRCQVSGSSK